MFHLATLSAAGAAPPLRSGEWSPVSHVPHTRPRLSVSRTERVATGARVVRVVCVCVCVSYVCVRMVLWTVVSNGARDAPRLCRPSLVAWACAPPGGVTAGAPLFSELIRAHTTHCSHVPLIDSLHALIPPPVLIPYHDTPHSTYTSQNERHRSPALTRQYSTRRRSKSTAPAGTPSAGACSRDPR